MSTFLTLYKTSTLHFRRASTRTALCVPMHFSISRPCKFSRWEIKGNGIKGYARALFRFYISFCRKGHQRNSHSITQEASVQNYTVLCISSNSPIYTSNPCKRYIRELCMIERSIFWILRRSYPYRTFRGSSNRENL